MTWYGHAHGVYSSTTDYVKSKLVREQGEKPAASNENIEEDNYARNILLIGPSQNGKSGLANFLFSGNAINDNAETLVFPMGNGTKSMTRVCRTGQARWVQKYLPPEYANRQDILTDRDAVLKHQKHKRYTIRIVDTPGIGHSDEAGEQEMMVQTYDFLKYLYKRSEKLSVALVVLKYPPLLSQDLERNIQFYKNMIPDVMNSNVMLVVTGVENNAKWIKKQMKGGRPNPVGVISEIRKTVQQWLGLDYNLPVETIDTLCKPKSKEENDAKMVRYRIFAVCTQSEVELNKLRLPKTKSLLREDREQIEKLQGEKVGLEKGIQLMEEALSGETKKISEINAELQKTTARLAELKAELEAKDSNKVHKIYSESYADDFRFLWWASKTFDVAVQYPICETRLAVGYPVYTIKEEKHIAGTLYSPFCRKLACNMALYTYCKDFYASAILCLKIKIEQKTKNQKNLYLQFKDKTNDKEAFAEKLESFRQTLSEMDGKIQLLSCEYLVLDDIQKSNFLYTHEGWDVINSDQSNDDDEEFLDANDSPELAAEATAEHCDNSQGTPME